MYPAIHPTEDPPPSTRLIISKSFRSKIGQDRVSLELPQEGASSKSRRRKRRRVVRILIGWLVALLAVGFLALIYRFAWTGTWW